MKTRSVVGIVVLAHGVAAGAIMLIQGCGTTTGYVSPPPEPVMPPAPVAPTPVVRPAVVPHPPVERTVVETTSYVVRKGDSLSAIAYKFGLSVAELVALNNIADPDKVRSGRKLILPGKVNMDEPRRMKKPAAAKPRLTGNVYEIQKGDSLSAIAVRFGTTVAELQRLNNLRGDRILAGQKLAIPEGAMPKDPQINLPDIPEPKLDSEPVGGLPAAPVGRAQARVAVPEVPKATGAAVAPADVRVHVVEEKEDLYSVAMMWGVSVKSIRDLNGLTETELKPGQRLKIPMTEE